MADNNKIDDWEDVPLDDWQDVPISKTQGIGDAFKHGTEALGDMLLSAQRALPGSGVVDKIGAASYAAQQEVADLFREKKDRKPFKERYQEQVDKSIEDYATAEERSPIASGVGTGVGTAASILLPIPGSSSKTILGAASRVLGSSGMSALDMGTRGRNLFDQESAKQAATLSGGIQAAAESLPVGGMALKRIAMNVGDGFDYIKNVIDRFGSKRALKASGAMTKDIKRLIKESNQANEIYEAARKKNPDLPPKKIDKVKETGDFIYESGLIKPTDRLENIQDRVADRYVSASDDLTASLQKLEESAGLKSEFIPVAMNAESQASGLIAKGASEPISSLSIPEISSINWEGRILPKKPSFDPTITDAEVADELQKRLLDKYKNSPSERIKAKVIAEEIEAWRATGNNRRSLSELNSQKASYDDQINYKNVTATERPRMEAIKEVRRVINNIIEDRADKLAESVGNKELSKKWKESKKTFGKLANIKDMVDDRMANVQASNFFSLRDTLVGGALGGAYSAGSGDSTDIIKGIPAALAMGVARRYGPAASAVAAKNIAKGIGKASEAAPRLGKAISTGLTSSNLAPTITRGMLDDEIKRKELEEYLNSMRNK